MAINQNHMCEELNGIKCAIVEKNVLKDRAEFLRNLLEYNGYTVVIATSPVPKAPATKPVAATNTTDTVTTTAVPPPPETFTIGVTNLLFNPVNAVYGRQLHTSDGHVVTPAYWQQKEAVSHDEIPYFERKL